MNRKGLRALGVSVVAAMGLMALMATGAQANWQVLDPEGTIVEPDVTLGAEAHTTSITMVVPAKELEFLCKKLEPDPSAPLLLLEKSTVGHGHIIFKECITLSKGVEQTKCKPVEPILAGGLVELVLSSSVNLLLFKPLTGKPFTTINIPETCALTSTSDVTGTLHAECGKLEPANTFVAVNCSTHEVNHLIRATANQAATGDGLFFGKNEAKLSGIAKTFINGPELYVGKKWGGVV